MVAFVAPPLEAVRKSLAIFSAFFYLIPNCATNTSAKSAAVIFSLEAASNLFLTINVVVKVYKPFIVTIAACKPETKAIDAVVTFSSPSFSYSKALETEVTPMAIVEKPPAILDKAPPILKADRKLF
jgi:hypothetical protein